MMRESLFFSTRNESALSRPKHEYTHRESFETDDISTEREQERENERENNYICLSLSNNKAQSNLWGFVTCEGEEKIRSFFFALSFFV